MSAIFSTLLSQTRKAQLLTLCSLFGLELPPKISVDALRILLGRYLSDNQHLCMAPAYEALFTKAQKDCYLRSISDTHPLSPVGTVALEASSDSAPSSDPAGLANGAQSGGASECPLLPELSPLVPVGGLSAALSDFFSSGVSKSQPRAAPGLDPVPDADRTLQTAERSLSSAALTASPLPNPPNGPVDQYIPAGLQPPAYTARAQSPHAIVTESLDSLRPFVIKHPAQHVIKFMEGNNPLYRYTVEDWPVAPTHAGHEFTASIFGQIDTIADLGVGRLRAFTLKCPDWSQYGWHIDFFQVHFSAQLPRIDFLHLGCSANAYSGTPESAITTLLVTEQTMTYAVHVHVGSPTVSVVDSTTVGDTVMIQAKFKDVQQDGQLRIEATGIVFVSPRDISLPVPPPFTSTV
ncbi:hypothetical protein K438DRAFT_1954067 [Mycena galopus ATCC 62051]|nr:hypothetical protein K438DRAFT_1954067 [Mycena galopus ATCC 62051]